jgi:hypothetical protein
LLAAPADAGELKGRIEELAARAWRHPILPPVPPHLQACGFPANHATIGADRFPDSTGTTEHAAAAHVSVAAGKLFGSAWDRGAIREICTMCATGNAP